ncbi:MAG: 5-bromo-4-chloroindolyl phosphate hydrolysis family protein [Alphaproteobacteria bacterium]|nr:5-bromo-4-chloroindolyl phosphate hydrolysis family protein [Alphaproteobacteria bacterium]
MHNDANWIVAGIAAAVTLPLAAFAGVPLIFAIGMAVVVFAGLVVVFAPKKLFEDERFARIDRKVRAEARDLLAGALPEAQKLGTAADRIADPIVRQKVNELARVAHEIFARLEDDPQKAGEVRRFMSFYLPRAAEVAEGYAAIETKKVADPKRLAEIGAVIDRLKDGFTHYADGLTEAELGSLDSDLSEIERSLEKDIGR